MPNGGRSNGNSKKKDGGQMENVSGKIGVVEFCEKRAMSLGLLSVGFYVIFVLKLLPSNDHIMIPKWSFVTKST